MGRIAAAIWLVGFPIGMTYGKAVALQYGLEYFQPDNFWAAMLILAAWIAPARWLKGDA